MLPFIHLHEKSKSLNEVNKKRPYFTGYMHVLPFAICHTVVDALVSLAMLYVYNSIEPMHKMA